LRSKSAESECLQNCESCTAAEQFVGITMYGHACMRLRLNQLNPNESECLQDPIDIFSHRVYTVYSLKMITRVRVDARHSFLLL